MKQFLAILIILLPTASHAQGVFGGGGGGGASGRNSTTGGGSISLHLSSVNNFPVSESVGFCYAIANRKKVPYLVCFKNTALVAEPAKNSYLNKTSVNNRKGSIKQSGRISSSDVEVNYSIQLAADGVLPKRAFTIGDTEYDLAKGRVSIVSGTDDDISIRQFDLEIDDPKQIKAWIEMMKSLQDNGRIQAPDNNTLHTESPAPLFLEAMFSPAAR